MKLMRLIRTKTPGTCHQIHFSANIFQKNKYKVRECNDRRDYLRI